MNITTSGKKPLKFAGVMFSCRCLHYRHKRLCGGAIMSVESTRPNGMETNQTYSVINTFYL